MAMPNVAFRMVSAGYVRKLFKVIEASDPESGTPPEARGQ